jgi:hypothetical protein
MSMLESIRGVLPLEVGGGMLATFFFNVHGPGERPAWGLTVTSEYWSITRGSETVLSAEDEGDEDSEEAVAFLVGTRITEVEGEDSEGGEVVFVFDGVYRLEVHHDPEDEAFVLITPEWFTVGY